MVMDSKTIRSVELRVMEDRDLEGVLELYTLVFGQVAQDRFVRRWEWGFGQKNMFPEASPKWVLTDRGKIAGFLAAIPLPYWINGQEVVAATSADYMVHPDYRFHGIKLMRKFLSSCPNCVTDIEMQATIKVTQWLGAKAVGPIIRYVKILDGRALGARVRGKVPSLLWWPATQVLRTNDLVRNRGVSSRVTVQPWAGFDERFARFSERLSQHVPIMPARDLRYLNWRYRANSPQADTEIGVVIDDSGELAGYVLSYLAKESRPKGFILDLQVVPPGNSEVAMALMGYGVERLRTSGAWLVQYDHLPSLQALPETVLQKHGFISRSHHKLLVKFSDDGFADIGERESNWNFSFGDSEASHSLA